MDVTASLDAPVRGAAMYEVVRDLATYPQWLDIVHLVQADQATSGQDCAWMVELRGKVGPFARSKRLRMVRTVERRPGSDGAGRVVFERRELSARRHSSWVLTADISESGEASTLAMHLHYGGALFTGGVLERLLAEQIGRGTERLLALLTRG